MKFKLLFLCLVYFLCSGCIGDTIFSKKETFPANQKIIGEVGNGLIFVTGKGVVSGDEKESPGAYLLAERAAIIDGYRLLSEKIAGLLLQSYSANENFNISKDQIMVQARSYVRGAEVVNVRHLKNGIVEADMKIMVTKDMLENMKN